LGETDPRQVVGVVQTERKPADMAFVGDELNRGKTAVRTDRLLGDMKENEKMGNFDNRSDEQSERDRSAARQGLRERMERQA
jgi:hypothetical protein